MTEHKIEIPTWRYTALCKTEACFDLLLELLEKGKTLYTPEEIAAMMAEILGRADER